MKIVDGNRMFYDRHEAGIALAGRLSPEYADRNALVLAIPRGGVIVGYEVARMLRGELSVLVTKKLPHPHQEELAIGALAEDGSVYLTAYARNVEEEEVRDIIRRQQREIESRIQRFRKGRPLPRIANRVVIIVDDGIATGSTIVPAIKLCLARSAAKVVVAAPVSGRRYAPEIDALADAVVVVEQPRDFYAVGQVYEDFHHLSDQEVTEVLAEAESGLWANIQQDRRK